MDDALTAGLPQDREVLIAKHTPLREYRRGLLPDQDIERYALGEIGDGATAMGGDAGGSGRRIGRKSGETLHSILQY